MLTAVLLSCWRLLAEGRQGIQKGLEHSEGELLLSDSLCWGCALQVSALQQGAGLRDGVAEEEGTVELGLKRLWKVGYGSCIAGACLPPDRRWGPALFSGATVQSISGLLLISPSLFSFHTPYAEKSIVLFPCPLLGHLHCQGPSTCVSASGRKDAVSEPVLQSGPSLGYKTLR